MVSDSNSESNNEETEKKLFDNDVGKEIKATLKTAIKAKVVHAVMKLQASYNHIANEIMKQSTKEKAT